MRLGFASEADLHLALHAVDALVLPYRSASESGLVHLARAVGVPVLASDAAQLSETVRATGAGCVLPRTAEAWQEAVAGPLPPPPPRPPALEAIGRAHLEAYARSIGCRRP